MRKAGRRMSSDSAAYGVTSSVVGSLLVAFLVAGPVGAADPQTRRSAPPNLVVILTDDQGYHDVGFNGCTDIPTPHIDRIAREGVRCTNGYVTFAVCGPSRAGLMTGRYQDRFGACRNPTVNPAVPNNGVPRSERTLAEILKPAGYTSMAVGKWHLGTYPGLRPRERGFDEFFGFLSGGHDYFPQNLTLEDLSEVRKKWGWYRTKILKNGRRVKTDRYLTDELSAAAVDFVERHHDRPFFLYLAYNAPHTPLQATRRYLDRFSNIENEKRRTYAAMVSAVDDGVGLLLDKLSEHGLDERTLVFFLSDNGGATNNSSRNTPLRGHKGDPFEGGIRVPFAVRWSGTLPSGVDYDYPVSSLDIAATIVAHAGPRTAVGKSLDGVDLVPHLSGKVASRPHEALYWRWFDQGRFTIRHRDHKLILPGGTDRIGPSDLLFDLSEDVSERHNLVQKRPEQENEARARLEEWKRGLVDPIAPGLGSWQPGRN